VRDAPRLRGALPVRVVALFAGLVVVAVAIVALLESDLGLPPWDVFHMGVSLHTPLSLGTASIVVGLALIAVSWPLGVAPGFGTVANAIVIGATIDVLTGVPAVEHLSAHGLPLRAGLIVAGIALFALGSALYIGAGLGAGPRDSTMIALSKRTGARIGIVRGGIEVTVLVAGLALGGRAGIGTVALALLVGPSLEVAFWCLIHVGLTQPKPEHVAAFGPLDVG
jgi:uncharacterized membrane protein YczE